MLLLGLPQSLALLLLGETPQPNAGSTGNPQGSPGPAPQGGNGGNADPAQGGNPQGSPQNPVPAPPGFIQPQEFYTLDPNNPDQRFTGVQAREAFIRAGQYDNLQGEYHRTQTELTQERQARQIAETQLQERAEQERLATYMQQMGYSPQPGSNPGQPQPQSQQPGQQQPGQQPGGQDPGAGAGDDWLMNYGFGQSPGQPEGTGDLPGQGAPNVQPGSPGAVPQTNSPQSTLNDPRQLSIMMRAIIQDELSKTLTPVQQQIPNVINAAVDQRFNQQARQDNVRNSFQAGRQQLSTNLDQKFGIDPNRSRDILDKWSLSSANYEEASRLMQGQYADDNQRAQAQQFADQKIAQGNMFFNSALEDALQAAQEGQAVRNQQDAQDQLMSGNYVDMGDLAQPNTNVWDPMQVDQVNRANLNKAMEIAETTGRLQQVAGPIGPAIQPSGFMNPGFIQPGQPQGYVPPTHPNTYQYGPPGGAQANPVPGVPQGQPDTRQQHGQPTGQPGQLKGAGWGAYQQQGYGPEGPPGVNQQPASRAA